MTAESLALQSSATERTDSWQASEPSGARTHTHMAASSAGMAAASVWPESIVTTRATVVAAAKYRFRFM